MAEAAGCVFISYSRRDYYLAESLSLQLVQRGVPAWMDVLQLQAGADWERALFEAIDGCAAFVLVASPAALQSPHVRSEWQRALAQGRRVLLLGWHRRVRLPNELQGCEWLDFRGRFPPALARLVQRLGTSAGGAPRAGARPGRGPWLPPEVAAVLAALLLPIAAYAYGVAPDVASQDFDDFVPGLGSTAGLMLFALFTGGVVWMLSVSLLQRRMGMTRLMGCLGFVATPFVLTLWKLGRHGDQGLAYMPALVAQRALAHLPWIWLLAALPALAMIWIVLARPSGLLHWMPTGKAWEHMRQGHLAVAQASAAMPSQALAEVRSFWLLHDATDQPLADELRAALRRQGAVEGRGPCTTTVLLLSNRSGRDWLAAQQQSLAAEPALCIVVGSAIGLPPQLGWLWQRQWIDLRRGALEPVGAAQSLPLLPEAVSQQRLPAPVARLHALLCAYAVLMGVIGHLLAPPAQVAADEATLPLLAGAGLCVALAWCARRLLRRELPSAALRRWLAFGLPAGLLFAVGAAAGPDLSSEARAVGAVGALAAAALAGLAWRGLPQVQSWLPADLPPLAPGRRLAPPADWRTFLTLVVFMFVWLLPVQLFVPQLMEPAASRPAAGYDSPGIGTHGTMQCSAGTAASGRTTPANSSAACRASS